MACPALSLWTECSRPSVLKTLCRQASSVPVGPGRSRQALVDELQRQRRLLASQGAQQTEADQRLRARIERLQQELDSAQHAADSHSSSSSSGSGCGGSRHQQSGASHPEQHSTGPPGHAAQLAADTCGAWPLAPILARAAHAGQTSSGESSAGQLAAPLHPGSSLDAGASGSAPLPQAASAGAQPQHQGAAQAGAAGAPLAGDKPLSLPATCTPPRLQSLRQRPLLHL